MKPTSRVKNTLDMRKQITVRCQDRLLRAQEPMTALTTLDKRGLVLQDGERLLQARDLRLTTGLAVLVRLWLRDAAVLHLAVVLIHGCQFSLRRVTVTLVLCGGLAQGLHFRGLVLLVALARRSS